MHDVRLDSPDGGDGGDSGAAAAPDPSATETVIAGLGLGAACGLIGAALTWLVLLAVFLAGADDLDDPSAACRGHEVWVWCLVTIVVVAASVVGGVRVLRIRGPRKLVGTLVASLAQLGFTLYGTAVWAAIEDADHGGQSCRDHYRDDSAHDNLYIIFVVTVAAYWAGFVAMVGYNIYLTLRMVAGERDF